MPRVFIIRAFGEKADSKGNQFNFDRVQSELMDPALKAFGLSGGTTAEIRDSGNIREDMFALILEADLVICDITIHNANVFYELGIRHALKKKHTLLLKADPSADATRSTPTPRRLLRS
jgi:nucleoside 2-deoxyribosyltransferase